MLKKNYGDRIVGKTFSIANKQDCLWPKLCLATIFPEGTQLKVDYEITNISNLKSCPEYMVTLIDFPFCGPLCKIHLAPEVDATSFNITLRKRLAEKHSLLCLGLDPQSYLLSIEEINIVLHEIVSETWKRIPVFKLNFGFYLAFGLRGMTVMKTIVDYIHFNTDCLVIGDIKCGDIKYSINAYAQGLFNEFDFDGITCNMWGGCDSIMPLIQNPTKGVFVWCHSSNKGSEDVQELYITKENEYGNQYKLDEYVASFANKLNTQNNVGLVVGVPPEEILAIVRQICPDMPFLIPGVGVQGGDLEKVILNGTDSNGRNILVAMSRRLVDWNDNNPKEIAVNARDSIIIMNDKVSEILEDHYISWQD